MFLASRRRVVCSLCLLWFAGWLCAGWFDVEMRQGWPLSTFGLIAYCAAGIGLLIWLTRLFWVRERRLASVAIIFALLPLVFIGSKQSLEAMQIARYRSEAHRREPLLAKLRAMSSQRRGQFKSADCHVEAGDPLRVAFHTGSGFLWSWDALVYDPTGQIVPQSKANTTPAVREAQPRRYYRFGSLPRSAEPLGNDWYYCRFSDD